jgi:Na+-translocating ferredoxin:NAD+ oxidoreductase RnfG subunit
MNLLIPGYGEKIESESSHWSLVISFKQMTNDK